MQRFFFWLLTWLVFRSFFVEPCHTIGPSAATSSMACFMTAVPMLPARAGIDLFVALALTLLLPGYAVPQPPVSQRFKSERYEPERPSASEDHGAEYQTEPSTPPCGTPHRAERRATPPPPGGAQGRTKARYTTSGQASESRERTGRQPRRSAMGFREALAVFGFSALPSAPELRKAYRRLAMQHHPDRNNCTPESATKFVEIAEAYRVLQRYAKAAA